MVNFQTEGELCSVLLAGKYMTAANINLRYFAPQKKSVLNI